MGNIITYKEKEFFMVYKGLFQNNEMKKTDKMTYIYLSSICTVLPEPRSFPSLKDLNLLFGITRPTFKNISRRLSEAGLVEKNENVNGNDFYMYYREGLNKTGNFFFLHYAVIRSKLLTPRQKLIYAFIISRTYGEEMIVEASMKTIAEKCSIRDDIILRNDIEKLVSIGLITKKLLKKRYMGRLQYDKYQYECLEVPMLFFEEQNKTVEQVDKTVEKEIQNDTDKRRKSKTINDLSLDEIFECIEEDKDDYLKSLL